MKIALFGHQFNTVYLKKITRLIKLLIDKKADLQLHKNLYYLIEPYINLKNESGVFENHEQLEKDTDLMISIGGDGTLLDSVTIIRDSGIPILGINIGKLGFLSSVSIDEAEEAVNLIFDKNYELDKRSLIKFEEPSDLFGNLNYGLNEFSVIKRDTSTMITISVDIDDVFLNTYWADGLIISTPTGSTGYSLSCGGPIVSPESNNFIITPIASHNLTVRPIVIPDKCKIKVKVVGYHHDFLCVLDSRSRALSPPAEILLSKLEFEVNLVSLECKNFYKTIRNKLAWGFDKRN